VAAGRADVHPPPPRFAEGQVKKLTAPIRPARPAPSHRGDGQ
jgi:hypothetical protein